MTVDRAQETLGTSDRGIVMFRSMLREALAAINRGEDPPGVCRDPAPDLIRFDASQTRDGQVLQE